MADYDAQSAVELVLRPASLLLWRLRRATTMETGLFEMQADQVREFRQPAELLHSQKLSMRCSPGLTRSMPNRLMSTPTEHRTASQPERKPCPVPGRNLLIPPPTSRVAFCASPIYPALRSTGSAGMKQSYGAKSAKSCSPSMEGAVLMSEPA